MASRKYWFATCSAGGFFPGGGPFRGGAFGCDCIIFAGGAWGSSLSGAGKPTAPTPIASTGLLDGFGTDPDMVSKRALQRLRATLSALELVA